MPSDGVEIPSLLDTDKEFLTHLKNESSIQLVKFLRSNYGFGDVDSKFISQHINEKSGLCNRCGCDELEGECVYCPQCDAFNW